MRDSLRDLFNDDIGIQIGRKQPIINDKCKQECMKAIGSNRTINSDFDPRSLKLDNLFRPTPLSNNFDKGKQ